MKIKKKLKNSAVDERNTFSWEAAACLGVQVWVIHVLSVWLS